MKDIKVFKINDEKQIVCEAKKTRNGFKHEATLVDGRSGQNFGADISPTVKINYLNRTWESFEFESVLNKLLDKLQILPEKERDEFMAKASGQMRAEWEGQFKTVAMIAKLGDLFGTTQQQKNDWKTRMLKAGLENAGLIMPTDWEGLSEEDKTARLDGVIKMLGKDIK